MDYNFSIKHFIFLAIGYMIVLFFWSVELNSPTLNVDDYFHVGGGITTPNIFLASGRLFTYFENVVFTDNTTILIIIKHIIGLLIFYTSTYTTAITFYMFCSNAMNTKTDNRLIFSLILFSSIWASVNIYTYELLSFDSSIMSYSLCFSIFPFVIYYFDKANFKYLVSLALATFLCLGTYQTALLPLTGLVIILHIINLSTIGNNNRRKIIFSVLAVLIGLGLNILLIYLITDINYERVSLFNTNSLKYILSDGLFNILKGPWINIFFVDGIAGLELKLMLVFTHFTCAIGLILFLLNRDRVLLALSVSSCLLWYLGWAPDAFFTPKLSHLNLRHVAPTISLEIILSSILIAFIFSRFLLAIFLLVFIASLTSGINLIQTTQRQSFINTIDLYVAKNYLEDSKEKYNKHTDDLRHICNIPGWTRNSIWRSAFHTEWSYNHIFSSLEHPRLKLKKNSCLQKITEL